MSSEHRAEGRALFTGVCELCRSLINGGSLGSRKVRTGARLRDMPDTPAFGRHSGIGYTRGQRAGCPQAEVGGMHPSDPFSAELGRRMSGASQIRSRAVPTPEALGTVHGMFSKSLSY